MAGGAADGAAGGAAPAPVARRRAFYVPLLVAVLTVWTCVLVLVGWAAASPKTFHSSLLPAAWHLSRLLGVQARVTFPRRFGLVPAVENGTTADADYETLHTTIYLSVGTNVSVISKGWQDDVWIATEDGTYRPTLVTAILAALGHANEVAGKGNPFAPPQQQQQIVDGDGSSGGGDGALVAASGAGSIDPFSQAQRYAPPAPPPAGGAPSAGGGAAAHPAVGGAASPATSGGAATSTTGVGGTGKRGDDVLYIEIGASVGGTFLPALHLADVAVAIDADAARLARLGSSIALNGHLAQRVRLLPLCVSGAVGASPLYAVSQPTGDDGAAAGDAANARPAAKSAASDDGGVRTIMKGGVVHTAATAAAGDGEGDGAAEDGASPHPSGGSSSTAPEPVATVDCVSLPDVFTQLFHPNGALGRSSSHTRGGGTATLSNVAATPTPKRAASATAASAALLRPARPGSGVSRSSSAAAGAAAADHNATAGYSSSSLLDTAIAALTMPVTMPVPTVLTIDAEGAEALIASSLVAEGASALIDRHANIVAVIIVLSPQRWAPSNAPLFWSRLADVVESFEYMVCDDFSADQGSGSSSGSGGAATGVDFEAAEAEVAAGASTGGLDHGHGTAGSKRSGRAALTAFMQQCNFIVLSNAPIDFMNAQQVLTSVQEEKAAFFATAFGDTGISDTVAARKAVAAEQAAEQAKGTDPDAHLLPLSGLYVPSDPDAIRRQGAFVRAGGSGDGTSPSGGALKEALRRQRWRRRGRSAVVEREQRAIVRIVQQRAGNTKAGGQKADANMGFGGGEGGGGTVVSRFQPSYFVDPSGPQHRWPIIDVQLEKRHSKRDAGVRVKVRESPFNGAWWRVVSTGIWEQGTLTAIKAILTLPRNADKAFVDIGAWIGPTSLYAGHFAPRVIAFEADPLAFYEYAANLALNPAVDKKTRLFHRCIRDKPGRARLRGIGDSTSTVSAAAADGAPAAAANGGGYVVACSTLPGFMKASGLVIDDIALLKIDIEGSEGPLSSALAEMLGQVDASLRPSILLSVHTPLWPAAKEADFKRGVYSVLRLYSYVYDETLRLLDYSTITPEVVAGNTMFIMTNTDLGGAFLRAERQRAPDYSHHEPTGLPVQYAFPRRGLTANIVDSTQYGRLWHHLARSDIAAAEVEALAQLIDRARAAAGIKAPVGNTAAKENGSDDVELPSTLADAAAVRPPGAPVPTPAPPPPRLVVVDVGAGVGFASLFAARAGATKVVAIEPDPGRFEELRRNVASSNLTSTVTAIKTCISRTGGQTDIWPPLVWDSDEMHMADGIGSNNTVKGACVTLQSALASAGVAATDVSVMIIDVLGAESALIASLRQLLAGQPGMAPPFPIILRIYPHLWPSQRARSTRALIGSFLSQFAFVVDERLRAVNVRDTTAPDGGGFVLEASDMYVASPWRIADIEEVDIYGLPQP